MICRCGQTIDDSLINGPVRCSCGRWHNVELPRWAGLIARWRRPGDAGVGDTFHRLAERFGAEWVIAKLGIECECEQRRALWNGQYPYNEP